MKNSDRTDHYKRNQELEAALRELEGLLEPLQAEINSKFESPKLPPVFIVGCARSGTTLLFQYLASCGLFSYPSNLISRFYYAPYIGAKIQKLLFDLDSKGELLGGTEDFSFQSDLGKTKGPLQPHEFWYFWNRFFSFEAEQIVRRESKTNVNIDRFRKEMAAFESVQELPILMKAMNFNWDLELLASIFPNAFFIHVKRDVAFNAQSLLLSREKYFGDRTKWYSFKPPGYESLTELSPEEQVVCQVLDVHRTINSYSEIDDRIFELEYERFCSNPKEELTPILDKIGVSGANERLNNGKFSSGNKLKVTPSEFELLLKYKEIHA